MKRGAVPRPGGALVRAALAPRPAWLAEIAASGHRQQTFRCTARDCATTF